MRVDRYAVSLRVFTKLIVKRFGNAQTGLDFVSVHFYHPFRREVILWKTL
nr:MAG TPA: hypothetical protein [Caudoviricetes sp.]